MKKPKFNICTLALYASMLTGTQVWAVAPEQPVTDTPLTSDRQKVSYTIGVKAAQELKPYELDLSAYLVGYKDACMNSSFKLSEQDMNASISKFQQEIQAKREMEHQQMKDKMQQSAAGNLSATSKFLAANKILPGMQTTTSGLQYKIIKAASGDKAKLGQQVTVNYKGSTMDGKEFDNSYKRNRSETFKLAKGELIDGWVEALQLMPIGSTWQVTVPPALGYGDKGMPPAIEPNMVLVFEIELVAAKDPA